MLVCGKLVDTTSPMLVCARFIVVACDCLILVVSIMLGVPLKASTALKCVFTVPLVVVLINPDTFDETGNGKELEGLGSPWLA